MRGVVFTGNRTLELREFADPSPSPNEVVLQIKASGMCGSDLTWYRASNLTALGKTLGMRLPDGLVIAGHEPCGVVIARGSGIRDNEAHLGTRVMVHHYKGCGECGACHSGWSQLCSGLVEIYGTNAHGAHAPYMKVPADTLVPLPDGLSFETGAAISCGTGTAYAALRRMGVSGRNTIAVFGQGPVGLAATQLANAMGARVIALDLSPLRLTRAMEFGADHCINPKEDNPVGAIRELTRGRGVDFALDTSGSSDARSACVQATATWGTVCFVGEGGTVTLDVSSDLIRKQLTIFGSWTFSKSLQADCARFIAERKIKVDYLFTHRWGLGQAAEAYRVFDMQAAGKGVLLP